MGVWRGSISSGLRRFRSMAIVPLSGSLRERVGKGAARQSRRSGRIPAVVYGHGQAATTVAVDTQEFLSAIRHHEGGNIIVSLKLDGDEKTALIREVQRDPISQEILHLDFQEVLLTDKVRVEVSVHLVGSPRGVREGGGILEHINRQVEVECLATDIPGSIDADVTDLFIGDSFHVSDLQVQGVVILTDPGTTIATVVPPTVHETPVEPTEGEAAEAEAEEPEVISKGKEEEAESKEGEESK
jgi:large subunit ribosomal protein L25